MKRLGALMVWLAGCGSLPDPVDHPQTAKTGELVMDGKVRVGSIKIEGTPKSCAVELENVSQEPVSIAAQIRWFDARGRCVTRGAKWANCSLNPGERARVSSAAPADWVRDCALEVGKSCH